MILRPVLERQFEASRYGVLGVRDTGPGMSEEVMGCATEAFYRAPGTRTSGSGLGLSIVEQVPEVQGGYLVLEHNVPSGLEASLWLALR